MPLTADTLVQARDGGLHEIEFFPNGQSVWIQSEGWQSGSLVPEGTQPTVEIRTSDGFIHCTPDHRIPVRGDEGIVEKEARHVTADDLIASAPFLPEGSDNRATTLIDLSQIARQAKRANQPHFIDDDMAYFIGYLTGDGSAYSHNSKQWNRVSWSDQDLQLAELVAGIVADGFGVKAGIFKRNDADCYVGYVDGVVVGEFLRKNFETCLHRGATNRTVPPSIQRLGNSGVSSFLAGLFDAEGHVSRSNITLGMVSPKLIEQVVLLLRRLGIYGSTGNYLPRPVGKHRVYRLTIADFGSLVRFLRHIRLRSSKKEARLASIIEKKRSDRVGQSDLRDVPHFCPLVERVLSELRVPATVLPNFRGAKARPNLCITGELAKLWLTILKHYGGRVEELEKLWAIKWTRVHSVETGSCSPAFNVVSSGGHHFRGSAIFTQGLGDSSLEIEPFDVIPGESGEATADGADQILRPVAPRAGDLRLFTPKVGKSEPPWSQHG